MLLFEPGGIAEVEWHRWIDGSPQASLPQCWEYAEAKALTSSWRVERGILCDGDLQVGVAQALVRKLPMGVGGLAWINRAPLLHSGSLDGGVEAIARYYADDRGFHVRLAPPIRAEDAIGSNFPVTRYRVTSTPGWASARLDLTRSEDDLLAGLRGNWRNSLRKAERSGFEVAVGTDAGPFAAFIDLYRRFLDEHKFTTSVTPDFLIQLQSLLPEARKMIVLTAVKDNEVLASILVARYGPVCEYLAGPSAGRARGMGLGQLLLWRAILDAKGRGYTLFDVGGMEPGVTPKGIYDFKAGIRPTPYRLMNEIEAGQRTLMQKAVRAYVRRTRAVA